MRLAYRSGMAAYLDPLEWRLEQLRGQSCVVVAESWQLIAETAGIVERLRQIRINPAAAQTQPPDKQCAT
jgi:hypothetical protein